MYVIAHHYIITHTAVLCFFMVFLNQIVNRCSWLAPKRVCVYVGRSTTYQIYANARGVRELREVENEIWVVEGLRKRWCVDCGLVEPERFVTQKFQNIRTRAAILLQKLLQL